MKRIGLVIIEDDKFFREGIEEMLKTVQEIDLLGSFGSAEPFIHVAEEFAPDVVLIDIGLPGLSGIEAIPLLKEKLPQTQFLVWTVFEDNNHIFDALRVGANGYILKSAPVQELVKAIRNICAGGSPMTPSIARKVIETFQKPVKVQEDYSLSKREKEILYLLSQGYSYKNIADKLFISIDTVRSHIRKIYGKLQVKSKLEAINKYYGRK